MALQQINNQLLTEKQIKKGGVEMIDRDYREGKASMPLTLEQHFEMLAQQRSDVRDLYSLWNLLRKDLEDKLTFSRGTFVHFSLHDSTHSHSIIRAIERFLGEERISQMSATDTFMLLSCAYSHDYGMGKTFNQIYDILGDKDFERFLLCQKNFLNILGREEAEAVSNLLGYIWENRGAGNLQALYFSIMVVVQMYLRPTHWEGVRDIWKDFRGLLQGRLKGRFIQGEEGIIDICQAHGQSFDAVLKMKTRADGIVGDEFHPRFVAAMLRLGDLLDLDNGRFPRWFETEIGRDPSIIPELSTLHYYKHEAVSHLLITPKRIEISVTCFSKKKGYEVADLASEWISWLTEECENQVRYWSDISQPDFGRPPRISKAEIMIDGKPYMSGNRKLQMVMSQDRVMRLLEGTNIYQDQYVGIRELVQNAVDASLLQMWYDISHNRYINIGVSKYGHMIIGDNQNPCLSKKKELGFLELSIQQLQTIFNNYEITVELIQHLSEEKVYVVVKDKGIGITIRDAEYMSDIGTSKEKNKRLTDLMKGMPRWLKPSGVFGIGLQSAFQLTDQIEFYTRQMNEPERLIIFHSYGRNSGKIEIRELLPDSEDIFHDNTVPGTNVKIAIEPKKLFVDAKGEKEQAEDHLLFYDMEFDSKDILHALYVELSQVIENILHEYPCDFFNIYFQTMKINLDKTVEKGKKRRVRYSYFSPRKDKNPAEVDKDSSGVHEERFYHNSILPLLNKKSENKRDKFYFYDNIAYYADEDSCRIYRLQVRPCEIQNTPEGKYVQLPEPVKDLYRFQYKFNPISHAESIYPLPIRSMRGKHAGFVFWDINILDDTPTKYLNIDRDRLREGAILEEELSAVRKVILKHWCSDLIKRFENAEEKREKRNKSSREDVQKNRREVFRREEQKNIYKSNPDVLLSLAILFYQNISQEDFYKFIAPYESFLKEQKLTLKDESFDITELWKKGAKFQAKINFPTQWINQIQNKCQAIGMEEILIHASTIKHLPHRLVHIFEISLNSSYELCYRLTLGPDTSSGPIGIQMDYAARLYDYSKAIEPDASRPKRINVDSLVRKVMKPNQEYPHLLISRYPKSFRRGENFALPLDHCIRWYIISPFDRKMTKFLSDGILDTHDQTSIKSTITSVHDKMRTYLHESEHFEKCINYVYQRQIESQKELGQAQEEDLKEIILKEYIAFILDCCTLLIEQRDLVRNQFKSIEPK